MRLSIERCHPWTWEIIQTSVEKSWWTERVLNGNGWIHEERWADNVELLRKEMEVNFRGDKRHKCERTNNQFAKQWEDPGWNFRLSRGRGEAGCSKWRTKMIYLEMNDNDLLFNYQIFMYVSYIKLIKNQARSILLKSISFYWCSLVAKLSFWPSYSLPTPHLLSHLFH